MPETSNREIAETFLEVFKSGAKDAFLNILHPDFHFKGPWLETHSADEYIIAFAEDTSVNEIRILKIFETEKEVCIIYELVKETLTTPVMQTFLIDAGRIRESLLIFDTGVFLSANAHKKIR